ncbi:hypothetical protein [Fischerella sp. PCC 9605]|uniref:hypothetical protein n=1 Tax=Fischerella sp. PCC 9605 TaxID=1173024 RepID=UPI00047D60F9|nr:hypothetical protein [Fischerella sp. PCC 9605]
MRSNNPESIRLYNLKVRRTELSKQIQKETDEDKRNEIEAKLNQVESEIDLIYTRREGEAHINWLLSEFGDDVFPDRD